MRHSSSLLTPQYGVLSTTSTSANQSRRRQGDQVLISGMEVKEEQQPETFLSTEEPKLTFLSSPENHRSDNISIMNERKSYRELLDSNLNAAHAKY